MSCPTCDHTMRLVSEGEVGQRCYWCPRCGTIKNGAATVPLAISMVQEPMLVERCREFETEVEARHDARLSFAWGFTGIAESINLPENRA
jgi:hypothetical protein